VEQNTVFACRSCAHLWDQVQVQDATDNENQAKIRPKHEEMWYHCRMNSDRVIYAILCAALVSLIVTAALELMGIGGARLAVAVMLGWTIVMWAARDIMGSIEKRRSDKQANPPAA